MYDKLSRFRFGVKENTGPEPTGDPATVLGRPVTPADEKARKEEKKRYEDIATDVLTKIGSDEAESRGHKKGEAKHFEYVREFVKGKLERLRREDMEPGTPAASPDDPQATRTDKEIGERRGRREGDEIPPFIKAKMDKDAEDERRRRHAEGRRKEGDETPPEDDDEPPEDDDERRKKTEAMIEAVAKGDDPHRIVESLFRR